MRQKEQRTRIHALKAQYISECEITRRLGISLNTVAPYLTIEQVPPFKPREPRRTKLGAFASYILRVSAVIAALALLRELLARSYERQLRCLQAFMNAHKSVPMQRVGLTT